MKILPLFKDQEKFEPVVGGQKLQMENILVYYVDEEAPTFTMQNLSGGIIAVIVVVVLAVVIGLLVLVSAQLAHFVVCAASVLPEWTHAAFSPQFFLSKRGKKRYNKTQVSFLWLSQLLRDKSRVPDNKTFSFSNSKERWRPCKLSVLAADVTTEGSVGSVPFSQFNLRNCKGTITCVLSFYFFAVVTSGTPFYL